MKDKLEAERRNVVACDQCAPNDRRGGDIRTVLAPSTVGTSSGFGGTVAVEPGEAVAEHYHPYSEEYLFVVAGELRVDLDGESRVVSEGEAVFVPRNVKHRLVNTGVAPVSAVFFLSPLAPRPEIGHVDTESKEEAAAIAAAAVGLVGSGTGA
nr:cupin domain-containing protein [Kibdelosporangium sp. MJ126-NF4]